MRRRLAKKVIARWYATGDSRWSADQAMVAIRRRGKWWPGKRSIARACGERLPVPAGNVAAGAR